MKVNSQPGELRGWGWILVVALAVGVALPPRCFAQLSNASLSGVITDASGGVIPGVDVTAEHVATGTNYRAVTDKVGRYEFLNLQTGNYTITATFKGFKTAVRTGVVLTVNQAANLDLDLEPGTTTQVVNVSSQAPLVNATNATIGTEITSRDFEDMPISGRNYTQLLALTPGSTNVDDSQSAGRLVAAGSSNNPTIQGDRNRDNWYMIDGAPNNELSFNGLALVPPLDSIQEVKVESGGTDTQFGGESGGYVNLTIKSGTDRLHGSLYEYVENSLFNCRNPFTPNVNVTPFQQNQFGVSVGGPIIFPKIYHPGSKRTWFFASYEGYRHHAYSTTLTRVPTAAEVSGNFSGTWSPGGLAINTIYNPATTAPDPANPGKYTRTQFPGNIIPSSMISSAASGFLSEFMPLPNFVDPETTRSDNFEENLPSLADTDALVIRIDHNLTQRDHLSGHYLYFTGFTGGPAISVKPMSSTVQNPNQNYSLEWDRSQSPTLFFSVQYAYQYSDYPTVYTTAPNYINQYDWANPNGYTYLNELPSFSWTSYTTPFGQGNSDSTTDNNLGTVNVQKIWGKHTFKVGYDLMHMRAFEGSLSQTEAFAVSQTQNLESPSGTGDAMASFMLGLPSTASRYLGTGYILLDGWAHGAYAQDTFRVNKKLTLNYGLRWDYRGDLTSSATEGSFNIQTGGWYLDGPVNIPGAVFSGPNVRKGIWQPNDHLFAPHFGAAYTLRPKTVIRAGFGLYYDLYNAWVQDIQGPRNAWPVAIFQSTPNLNTLLPTVTLTQPFQGMVDTVETPDPRPASGYQINPYAPVGYVQQWNLAAEHSFSDNTVLTVTYTGSRGVHLDCCGLYNMARTPQVGVPESSILASSLVPWPDMDTFRTNMGDGWDSYNALEIGAQKRMSHGITFMANYTWSHSLDDACSGSLGTEGCFQTNVYQPQWDYSNSAFDLPNVFHAIVDYQLPIGENQALSLHNRSLNNALGGWQVSAVIVRQSGTPITISQGEVTDLANVGSPDAQAPNLTCNPNLAQRTITEWFNTSCFALPAQYTFGNDGRNTLRGPAGPGTYALSAMKNFQIHEDMRLQYRADFFNAFNYAYPSSPNASFGVANFGEITGGSGGRTIQMALRLTF